MKNNNKIKIISDENDFFEKNNEYYINITLIKKINDIAWKKLNEEIQKKINEKLEVIYGKNKEDFNDYDYSSADDSIISNSDFGISEDEEQINDYNKKINKRLKK